MIFLSAPQIPQFFLLSVKSSVRRLWGRRKNTKTLTLNFVAGYSIHSLLLQPFPTPPSPPLDGNLELWSSKNLLYFVFQFCLCLLLLHKKNFRTISESIASMQRDCSNIYTRNLEAAPPFLHSGSELSTCCCYSFHFRWKPFTQTCLVLITSWCIWVQTSF